MRFSFDQIMFRLCMHSSDQEVPQGHVHFAQSCQFEWLVMKLLRSIDFQMKYGSKPGADVGERKVNGGRFLEVCRRGRGHERLGARNPAKYCPIINYLLRSSALTFIDLLILATWVTVERYQIQRNCQQLLNAPVDGAIWHLLYY